MSKLVLIDSHAILHRAYHALPPLTSPDGTIINAVYGFTTMFLTILETLKPTHVIAAFDLPAPTFRQQLYTAYQGKRPDMEGNLVDQIPLVKGMLDALGIQRFEVPGFEADDVIGTLARQAVGNQESRIKNQEKLHNSKFMIPDSPIEVIIVTGDRDMLQLVNHQVSVLVPIKGLKETKLFHRQQVIDDFGVTPEQWVDVKALKGDASDNYPGVSGIGPKTAEKLIAEFGTLENLYEKLVKFGKLDKFGTQVAIKLAQGAESAGLGKKLATIVTDVPTVHLDLENSTVEKIDWHKGMYFMGSNFGFRTIVRRIEKEILNQKSKGKIQKLNSKTKPDEQVASEQMELI